MCERLQRSQLRRTDGAYLENSKLSSGNLVIRKLLTNVVRYVQEGAGWIPQTASGLGLFGHLSIIFYLAKRHSKLSVEGYQIKQYMIYKLPANYRTRVQSLATLVTHQLNHCCLVDLIDVTLAYEDANSKIVEIVTDADVSDENRVCNSLLQIWKLRFGHKA